MIKINLLPKTINQKRVIRNTAIMFACLLILVIAAGIAYGVKLKGDVADMEQLAAAAEQAKTEVEGIKKRADEITASIAPIKQKVDFINAVLEYNKAYPKLYEEVAKWTYDKVALDSLQCDGTQIQMAARVKTLDDLGRYLLNMYRATDLFTEVTISGIPGYGSGPGAGGQGPSYGPMGGQIGGSMASLAGLQAIESGVDRAGSGVYGGGKWINFTVTCKLKTPIVAPQFAGAGATAAGQQPGAMGPMPAAPGGMAPMGPMGPMGPAGPMGGAPGPAGPMPAGPPAGGM